jgi:hypothetical protein
LSSPSSLLVLILLPEQRSQFWVCQLGQYYRGPLLSLQPDFVVFIPVFPGPASEHLVLFFWLLSIVSPTLGNNDERHAAYPYFHRSSLHELDLIIIIIITIIMVPVEDAA